MSISLLLRCRDRNETREFYTSILGFEATESAQGALTVSMEGGAIIFTALDLWESELGCSGTIYFTVRDVDAYYEIVKDQADVAWPLQDMSYGTREFAVTDCNGYILAFQSE